MRPTSPFAAALLCASLVALPASAQAGANEAILNPNLASADELAALAGMTGPAVEAVTAGRPFLTQAAFDAALAPHLAEEARLALYALVFVPINLNEATREEILMIPNAGARMAREFFEYRPYVALAQFEREIGKYVDDDEVARLAQYVFVPIDLNSASDEAILSLPGVGARMLREFKEYRPYTSMEQFRREMGKYVDDGEVARLARFVYIGEG